MSIQAHKWRDALALIAAALALFVLSFRPSSALSIRLPLTELGAASQAIIQGRVERIESAYTPDGSAIESTVYVRVADVPRGLLRADTVVPVRVLGGTVDGLTMASSEEAIFTPGEDVYLFLTRAGDAYRVAGGEQGKFEVLGDRAISRAWGETFPLRALNTGAQGGPWPAESAAEALQGSAAAVGPENYVYEGQHWPGSNPMEETYEINVNTADAGGSNGSANDFRNAIRAAADTWSRAGAKFRFQSPGSTSIATVANDGHNVIFWENMGSSSTLAEARWWYYNDGSIADADIHINDYYLWDATGSPAGNEQDLQSVLVHELGHWLSLGHDTDARSIMYYSYTSGSIKRTLYSNDVAGIKAIYGSAATTPVPPTPTATRTPAPTRTPTPHPTLAPWQIKSRSYLPMIIRR